MKHRRNSGFQTLSVRIVERRTVATNKESDEINASILRAQGIEPEAERRARKEAKIKAENQMKRQIAKAARQGYKKKTPSNLSKMASLFRKVFDRKKTG